MRLSWIALLPILAAPAAAQEQPDTLAPLRRTASLASPVRATDPCVIARVVDGDTIHCVGDVRVRLIGIDTPELSQEPFGTRAREALEAVVAVGDTVLLERDIELMDRYERYLAYVWRDDVPVNWVMVRNGWAVVLTYPPNVQYVDQFAEAQRAAREEERGLWAVDGFVCSPRDHRRGRCED
jgi:micrococcal nuclease